MGKLDGKVAVITGGNSGIGLATAKQFVAEGAYVYITGRRQEELDKAVKEIGDNVTALRSDVLKLDDIDELYATVAKKHPKIDILFANAGSADFSTLGKITEEHFDKWFGINVKGLLFTVQKALPLIPEGGSIILNGSIAGVKGLPDFSVYNATKAAVRSFARSWTSDLKGRNIRVNVISPGPIDTPAIDLLANGDKEASKQIKADLVSLVPLGRIGLPEEVAKTAVFLASDDSSFITGIDLSVDGGMAQV